MCVTHRSITVIIVYFDQCLFDKLLHISDDLYGKDKLTVPTWLHHKIQHMKHKIA